VASDERLRAPQIRAAERLGQLQEAYVNAKTPEEQAAIASQMRAYSGKDEDWKVQVTLQSRTWMAPRQQGRSFATTAVLEMCRKLVEPKTASTPRNTTLTRWRQACLRGVPMAV
jgi:hypothetical protein